MRLSAWARIAIWSAGLLIAAPVLAQTPVGSQFQVNTFTLSDSSNPAVAFHANGEFVVAYDTNAYVYGQRFAANGTPVGGEFDVSNNGFGGDFRDPMIAIDGNDNSVMCFAIDDGGRGTGARRFSSSGAPLDANAFIVGLAGVGSPAVAADGNGDFIVAWPGRSYEILARRYLADGSPVGGEFQVTTSSPEVYDRSPTIAANDAGDFVVAWRSNVYEGPDPCDILGQRLDSAGGLVGAQFQVNSYTTGCQASPSVTVEADGDFLVVWTSAGSETDTSDGSIQAQRFAADASPIGAQFQVNSYTTGSQGSNRKALAMSPNGDFLVTWQSDGSAGTDTDGTSVQARRFDAAANPVGVEFQVNTYTTSYQRSAAVALAPNGDFVVAWSSDGSSGSDSDRTSIQGQRFTLPEPLSGAPTALFALIAIRRSTRGNQR